MNEPITNPFGITREEMLELAATKLADTFIDTDEIAETARKQICARVEKAFSERLNQKIDDFLSKEMERLMSVEICPVDIWGDKTGSPTTIKAVLAERARVFWDVKVNDRGEVSGYGGTPRHEYIFRKIAAEEFTKAINQNLTNIVGAFKDSLAKDAASKISEHLESIIRVKTK